MKNEKKSPFLTVAKGDTLRDCDPRSKEERRLKKVLEVRSTDATIKGDYEGAVASVVSRLRIHDKPDRKTGYYLVPKG